MRTLVFTLFIFFYLKTAGQDSIIANSIGMKFKRIPAGRFYMGTFSPTVSAVGFFSNQTEPLHDSIYENAKVLALRSSMPGFEVKIQDPYYIGVYEVSQLEWKKIMNKNPSVFDEAYMQKNTDDYPVEHVSWKDCKKFITKMNKKDKGKFKYRLPTETEWEYAARGGNKDDISWPEIWKTAVTGVQTPAAKGSKEPNFYGLFDVLGNVWEWVEDKYNAKIFADPSASGTVHEHVIKGSCFYGDVKNATYMTHAGGKGKRYDIGFRLIIEKVN